MSSDGVSQLGSRLSLGDVALDGIVLKVWERPH
jgi:hypothetical protein